MFCSSIVLPAFGGETIRPRWPMPIGATRSMMRAVMSSVLPLPCSSFSRFFGKSGVRFSNSTLLRECVGRVVVDLADLEQREVAFVVLRRPDQPGDRVARAQIEAPDLARADVDVVGAGEIGAVGGAQEAEAVLEDLEHAVPEDVLAALRVALQDREDDVLLAGPGHVLEAHRLREGDELSHRLVLQLGEIHDVAVV